MHDVKSEANVIGMEFSPQIEDNMDPPNTVLSINFMLSANTVGAPS